MRNRALTRFPLSNQYLAGDAITPENVMSKTATIDPHVSSNSVSGESTKSILHDVCDNLFRLLRSSGMQAQHGARTEALQLRLRA